MAPNIYDIFWHHFLGRYPNNCAQTFGLVVLRNVLILKYVPPFQASLDEILKSNTSTSRDKRTASSVGYEWQKKLEEVSRSFLSAFAFRNIWSDNIFHHNMYKLHLIINYLVGIWSIGDWVNFNNKFNTYHLQLPCKVHRMIPYVRLGTYVKIRIRTCRILASQVRRYVSRIKL